MICNFTKIKEFIDNKTIFIPNKKLINLLKSYTILHISENISFDLNMKTLMKESVIIIINQFKENDENASYKYFIVGFKKTILIIEQSNVSFLHHLFLENTHLKICFLSDAKDIFDKFLKIKYDEIIINKIPFFREEIEEFNKFFTILIPTTLQIGSLFQKAKSCITSYLIRQSYSKLKQNRIENFYSHQEINSSLYQRKLSNFEYVTLRTISVTDYSTIELNYQIEKEELFVTKKPNDTNESTKLNKREIDNYSQIHYPLFPRFIGFTKDEKYPLIEFINGQTLSKIEQFGFNENEKCFIILQIMISINYLHKNGFVYRDLKPNNVMIDSNLNAILLDFDRMINTVNSSDDIKFTVDFSTKFVAPEVNLGNFSYKSDVYSIGQIAYYMFKMNPEIELIFKDTTNIDITKRPSVSELIFKFIKIYGKQIQYLINKNDCQARFINDECDFNENMMNDDFSENKNQNQSSNTTKENQPESSQNKDISNNENDNQSNIHNSFVIYGLNKNNHNNFNHNHFINIRNGNENDSNNIDQMIQFYTMAAKQNQPGSALLLYKYQQLKKEKETKKNSQINHDANTSAENEYDIKETQPKRINNKESYDLQLFLNKANEENDPESQYYLGVIYLENNFGQQDINKAIHYLTLSANQNYKLAQHILGEIYSNSKYVPRDINKAIRYYSLASDQNYAKSQYNLGSIYEMGQYVQCDMTKAIHYYSLAADQKFIKAQYNLGSIFYYGKNVPQDINKALYYYSLAANQNDADSQFMIGFIYFLGKLVIRDINKAIHYLSLAADQNHQFAQYCLGIIYSSSEFVLRDINKAIHYYSLSADQNNDGAQYDLASIYYKGEFIQRDIKKALHYFQLSADQNNTKAQINLGFIYLEGKYVQRNIEKAIYYYKLAANQNHPNALYNLGFIYQSGDYIQRDINKAIHYYLLASNQNDYKAQFNLGCIYYEGNFVPRDINKAIYYFQLAADQNDSRAQFNLGCIYIECKYIQLDIKKAIHYFLLAAKQNNPYAQFNLGFLYETNKFIPRDISKSIYYYSLAANQNYSDAQFNLGLIYFNGRYVIKNMNKAIYYFSLSAKQNHPHALFFSAMINLYNHTNIKEVLNHLYLSSINNNIDATFSLGFLYHEGKFIQRDIDKAIHYYKEASSFNNQYAKNNLGIIYKNGFEEKVQKNIGNAITYFEEAIHQNNDKVSLYNLAHIYLFEIQDFDKSIDLLIESLKQDFEPSFELLCLAIIKKARFDFSNIENAINKLEKKCIKKLTLIINEYKLLNNKSVFEKRYDLYKRTDFVYNYFNVVLPSESLIKKIQIEFETSKNTTDLFYEGFGINL